MISRLAQQLYNERYSISNWLDVERRRYSGAHTSEHKAASGQFFTPAETARFMAGLFTQSNQHIRLLDAGAGIGSLTAAFVESRVLNAFADQAAQQGWPVEKRELLDLGSPCELPATIHATLYEKDAALIASLTKTLNRIVEYCDKFGVRFEYDLHNQDFIVAATNTLQLALYRDPDMGYDCAILNPPYGKIRSDSESCIMLRRVGIETGNLYTAFVALAVDLLTPNGELVAITPRSFCNGPYFRPFRRHLLQQMSFRRIHIFDARDRAFQDDDVLQENVIFSAVKAKAADSVLISSSSDPLDPAMTIRQVDHDSLLDLKPEAAWHEATANQIGVTPMMDFIRLYYGKDYAPNTRETIRRQTLHQFVAAGLVEDNLDTPDLPVNSPKYRYRVTQEALALLSTFGSEAWSENVTAYLASVETLVERYARRRAMAMIPVRFGAGQDTFSFAFGPF